MMTTEDENSTQPQDHWQSVANELGADFDPSRAAPVQPNQDIEQQAAARRSTTAPRQPQSPSAFPTVDDLLKEPTTSPPAGDEVHTTDASQESGAATEVVTAAASEEDAFSGWSEESSHEEVGSAAARHDDDQMIAEATVEPDDADGESEWTVHDDATALVDDVADFSAAKPPPVAAREEMRKPPVEAPPQQSWEDIPPEEIKSSSHWSKLAGFLGIGGAKPAISESAPLAAPTHREPSGSPPTNEPSLETPEAQDSIFEAFSNDPETVQRKASQQFVDSMFGTDSTKLPPETDDEVGGSRFADTLDETEVETVRFESQSPGDDVDDGQEGDERDDDGNQRQPRRRRRRGSRGRGRERSSEALEQQHGDAAEPEAEDVAIEDDPFTSFHESGESAATADDDDSADDDSAEGDERSRSQHRRIPSWKECVNTIIDSNIQSHNRGGEGRPRRRRRRGGSKSAEN